MYADIQHSFFMSSSATETVILVSFGCVRFLGTGAGATDVRECVPHDELQVPRYLYHILHGSGPDDDNANFVCKRTHVMGILVCRAAAADRDPIPPADTVTIPHVEVKPPSWALQRFGSPRTQRSVATSQLGVGRLAT